MPWAGGGAAMPYTQRSEHDRPGWQGAPVEELLQLGIIPAASWGHRQRGITCYPDGTRGSRDVRWEFAVLGRAGPPMSCVLPSQLDHRCDDRQAGGGPSPKPWP